MKLSRLPHGFNLDTAAQGLNLGDGAVSSVSRSWTARGWEVTGTVSEGGRQYHSRAELSSPASGSALEAKLLDSACSCGLPRCRHVAALVLATDPPEGEATAAPIPEAAPASVSTTPLEPRLKQWLAGFETVAESRGGRGRQYELRYVLSVQAVNIQGGLPGQVRRAVLDVQRVPMKGGLPNYAAAETYPLTRKLGAWPSFVERDTDALELLTVATRPAHASGRWHEPLYALMDHPATNLLIGTLLDTGRLCWETASAPLTRAERVQARPVWQTDDAGQQSPSLEVTALEEKQDWVVLPLGRPWVVSSSALTLAPAEVGGSPDMVARFLSGPSVAPAQAAALAQAMTAAALPVPAPLLVGQSEENLPYTPRLHLLGRTVTYRDLWEGGTMTRTFALAQLRDAYGGHEIRQAASGKTVTILRGQTVVQVPRQLGAEQQAREVVDDLGFWPLPNVYSEYEFPADMDDFLALDDEEAWLIFMSEGREILAREGIELVIHPDFPLHFAEVDDWYGEAREGGGWFTLDLGIVVGGQRISLLPVLANLIAAQPELFTPGALAQLGDDELIFAGLDDGRKVPLPAGRVRSILGVLVELHLRELPPGPLRLPLLDAARLAELESAVQARWVGAEKLLALGQRLRDFGGIAEVAPPDGLRAEMRPYQLQGLSWLQFLREYELGGILADDMGLGKTLQTLAHLLKEKEEGRADLPTLVIAPTSVIGNWQAEAAKFTPDLKVLLLHGKDRHADFEGIPQADLILTTYPLLPRDIDELRRFEYHLVILDEAQNIKNNKTAAAKAAGSLGARHRLALTGTPLENHLGELWSQFNFLAPGLLHDEKTFQKLYRTPIEKRGDTARQAALSARVRPFILRREKKDVARELPPKTEIPVRVTLEGDQRDLYETVRVTMQSRVREELAARGLARSTIAILDALLKLRQAVTDPRLVKLDAARSVENNAKFEWLEGNLPQMLEEGRRVLLFSGFATLLGHLEEWLKREKIPYSKITGQTKDRQKQIDAFQSGQTHVFLITLKAGGVGLNLTAADTVIHYDPWWNPAAEDQATDRAYRIGQDKPVFVYKLIAAGSVEERILDLQARKAALARGVLDGGLTDATQLTVQDLDRLFAPLELGAPATGKKEN